MRAACGCLVEDGMVLHGYDGPCTWERTVEPTIEDHCGQAGHGYMGDDAGVGVGQVQVGPVAAGQLPRDRQPEPGPARVAVARLVQSCEPLEDSLTVPIRYAVSIVAHAQPGPARVGSDRQGDARRGVPDRVVDEVGDDPDEVCAVGQDGAVDVGPGIGRVSGA